MPIIFDVTQQPTSPRNLENGFVYRFYHRYDFINLMIELFHMYDVANEPVLEQNVSCSIQTGQYFDSVLILIGSSSIF